MFSKAKISIPRVGFLLSFILVVLLLIIGFNVVGSPAAARLKKEDQLHRNNIVENARAIAAIAYDLKEQTIKLPASLSPSELSQVGSYMTIKKNPFTAADYTYKRLNDSQFQLCGEFNYKHLPYQNLSYGYVDSDQVIYSGDELDHAIGYQCFQFEAYIVEGSVPVYSELRYLGTNNGQ
jgi:hypothetical protein